MSFQQGLSGLNAASRNLETIGNNIANANTYGAKSSRAEFADMYATAMNGGGVNQVGIGVNLAAVSQQFTQGNISTTDNPLDLAINGSGFFQVSDGVNPVMYTRNGQFKVDREGYIVNNQQMRLVGYPADGQGVVQRGAAQPLQLPTAGIEPQRTEEIKMEFTLNSEDEETLPDIVAPAIGPTIVLSDQDTYNEATTLSVYDEQGQDVSLMYYFQKTAKDTWNVYITANGTSLEVDADGNPAPVTTMEFPTNGKPPTTPTGPVTIDIPATTNASTGKETMAIAGVQLDLLGARQWAQEFGVTAVTQDGYAPGQLTGITIEDDGIITARYSNGQGKAAGQIELASFRNPQGLQPMGGNMWARTFQSGDPVVGRPTDGNLGVLQAGALEESNVDLTAELVNMITAQRVYQANAQTIKTQDTLMQTLVNLR